MNSQSQRQGQYAFWWPLIYCRGIETWRTTTRRRRVLLSYQGDSDRLRLILLYLKYHGLSHDIYCRGPWELGTLTSAKKERFEKVYSPCLLLFITTGVMETVAFRSLFYCLISTPSRMKFCLAPYYAPYRTIWVQMEFRLYNTKKHRSHLTPSAFSKHMKLTNKA